MANPQLENGYVRISNELVEALSKTHLSSYETRILWCLFRKTYGWNKKTDCISYSQFEKDTGIKHWNIGRTLKRLISRKIITANEIGQYVEYGIQKDFTSWQPVSKQILPKPVSICSEVVSKEIPEPVSKMIHTKDNKDNTKDRSTLLYR